MRRYLKILVLCSLPLCIVAGYYHYYERFSRELIHKHHVYYEEANAIKHAYAAIHMFALLDLVVSAEQAERLVMAFGTLNERFEQIIRRPKDPAPEIVKDMWNNLVGVTAARWHAEHATTVISYRALAIRMAEKKALILRSDEAPMDSESATLLGQQAVSAAVVKLQELKPLIIEQTLSTLNEINAQ